MDMHGHRYSTTFTFCTFVTCMYAKDTNFIFGMPQIYTCSDTQTHAHTYVETPAHTDTCTQTYISTHVDIHRHTCILFTYTNTHTYMSGQFCLLILYLVAICQMSSGPHGPILLDHLVMSLCNHALSVMCHCLQCQCLCTAVPVTALIIETSYLADICQCDMYFLNGSRFSKFLYVALLPTWLNLEPSYLAQLCIDTGATHREEIMHLSIIFLKLRIFLKNHILHLLAYLAYMPNILSL